MITFIRLRTRQEPRFYVHELRGVCYVSFVSERDKAYAACFPTDKTPADAWRKVVESVSGCALEAVEIA